jgi:tetratricopeptide (TPR) repeat protein
MPSNRHHTRTFGATVVFAALATTAAPLLAQETLQKLFERGAFSEVVERAGDGGNPEATYLSALASLRLDNRDNANARFNQLQGGDGDAWKAIGESGAKQLAGDMGGAMDAANRAVEIDGENPYAHYQLGQIASRQNNFQRAAQAFARSVELKPDFAYGHYYAGMAFQRAKQLPKASEHLNYFVKLAPDAPEKAAVLAILRTLR